MLAVIHVSLKCSTWIIFASILFSCESSRNEDEFKFSEGELNFLDSVKIDEDNLPLGFTFNENLYLKWFTFK